MITDEDRVMARRYPMANRTQAQYSLKLAWRDYHQAKLSQAQLNWVLERYNELYGDDESA